MLAAYYNINININIILQHNTCFIFVMHGIKLKNIGGSKKYLMALMVFIVLIKS